MASVNNNDYPKTDYLKIGDVARKVGISPTVIRMWESLGLARPRRTASKYRLYTPDDVRLLHSDGVHPSAPPLRAHRPASPVVPALRAYYR